jgi:hypothetical protein
MANSGADSPTPDANPRAVEGSGGGSDPNSLVDRIEPENTVCDGAEAWPSLTIATSSGIVGWKDPADWSIVELYRTETMVAHVIDGDAGVAYAPDCASEPGLTAPMIVSRNGLHRIQVTPAVSTATYTLEYTITANDAGRVGTDIGNTPATSHYYNALPKSSDPRDHFAITGSLPNRDDFRNDQDLIHIGTGMAHMLDPNEFTLGLLTVTFTPDCNGGTYSVALVGPEGEEMPGLSAVEGCGKMQRSCIAAAITPVYARLTAESGRGTGYDFSADLSPLYVVSISNGDVSHIEPTQPWCDPVTPTLLGLMAGPTGIVDKQGQYVAKVTSPAL